MFKEWVIDVTHCEDELLCFVPIENMGTDDEALVLGVNVLDNIEHFEGGKVVGFVHLNGQEAVDKWVDEHPEIVAKVKEAQDVKNN